MNIEDVFGDLPILKTERTLLRKISHQDESDMYAYCSDEDVARYTTWYKHNSIEDTREFIEAVVREYSNHQVAPWGIEDKASGKLIGTAGFVYWNTNHARAELGYALSKAFWNKGYMSEIVARLIEFGFGSMELVRIEARCHPDNIGSARVMEKTGMEFEGILRKQQYIKGCHQDLKLYSIVK